MEDNTKKEILEILRRDLPAEQKGGVEMLLYYLEKASDFFTAPSSTIYHNNHQGGLAEHSLSVYKLLKKKVEEYGLDIPASSVAICGLLHDICKTHYYAREKKWRKKEGQWHEEEVWVVNDKFPVGHGEKSVILLQKFIKLEDDEILAIRWHMASFDPGIHFNYPSGYPFREATKECALLTLLITADMESSNIIESKHYNPNHKQQI